MHQSNRRTEAAPTLESKAVRLTRGWFVVGWLLPSLCFGAFFQGGFAAEFDAAFVVDADAFYPDHVANVCNVFGAFHTEVRELGNVHKPVPAWEYFDERAELFY